MFNKTNCLGHLKFVTANTCTIDGDLIIKYY